MYYKVVIHFTNGKVKTIGNAVKYRVYNGSLKVIEPDFQSLIIPFENVNFFEVTSVKEEEE